MASTQEKLLSTHEAEEKNCESTDSLSSSAVTENAVDTPFHSPVAAIGPESGIAVSVISQSDSSSEVTQSSWTLARYSDINDALEDGEVVEDNPSTKSECSNGTTRDGLKLTESKLQKEVGSVESVCRQTTKEGEQEEKEEKNVVDVAIDIHGSQANGTKTSDKIAAQLGVTSAEISEPHKVYDLVTPIPDAVHPEADVDSSSVQPTSTEEPIAVHAVDKSNDADHRQKNATDTDSNGPLAKKVPTTADPDSKALEDDEGPVVETTSEPPTSARSVPPHMRPTSKPPALQHLGPRESRRDWPSPVPRAPRAHHLSFGYQTSRQQVDDDELNRMRAQLMHVRNKLDTERKANAEIKKTVGAEKQASLDAAMSNMLADLLHGQAEVLESKAKVQEKERELDRREQKIEQLEIYLSDGQRQLMYQLEQQGIRPMSMVDQANLRREAELRAKDQFSDIESKISIKAERLRYQEAAQRIREQQFKVLIRDELEAEIREQYAQDTQVKVATVKAAEKEYERGFAEGKRIGVVEASEAARRQEFLKGYATCYHSQVALQNLRNGHIAADSPELAFLFDSSHPENLHNIGVEIGRMKVQEAANTKDVVGSPQKAMEQKVAPAAASAHKPHAVPHTVTDSGPGRIESDDASSTRSAQITDRTAHAQHEEPVRSAALTRPTFAGELRGSSTTSNAVFASKTKPLAIPSAPENTVALATKNMARASLAENVYVGRRMLRYEEDSDVGPASPNLIDLY